MPNGANEVGVGDTASGVIELGAPGVDCEADCVCNVRGAPDAGGPDCNIAGSMKGADSQTEISLISDPRKIMYWKTSSLGGMTLSVLRFSVPNDLTKTNKLPIYKS